MILMTLQLVVTQTCCEAKLRMVSWHRRLVGSGVEVKLALFYVDDFRLVLRGFVKGREWNKE